MLRRIEQEVWNIQYLQPKQNLTFNDWFTKKDTPLWIAAGFECMNVPLESVNENDSMEVFFGNKPVSIVII